MDGIKYLGLYIDNQFQWKIHINYGRYFNYNIIIVYTLSSLSYIKNIENIQYTYIS